MNGYRHGEAGYGARVADFPSYKVLLVDDDVELTEMLRRYLSAEGFEVDVVHDGEAGAMHATAGYDAVILDVMLPKVSGTQVLKRIRERSEIPVIMLTAKGDDVERAVGIELGADDYIAKPYFPRELVARLRAVIRRHGRRRDDPTSQLLAGSLQIDKRARVARVDGEPLDLTFAEFSLLLLLTEADGGVASKEEISLHVLGRPLQSFDRSVDVHVSNLRQKLSRYPAISLETLRKIGYRLVCR